MRQKISSKKVSFIAIPFGLALSAIIFFNFTQKIPTQSSPALIVENVIAQSNQEEARVGLPTRLEIPIIQVDTSIISVGLTSEQAMDVPKNPTEVAWYSLGSRPGEIGSAVIAGHYNWINNVPAVFDDLHKLSKGDKIFVEDENGMTITFVVREIRTYKKDDDAFNIFTSNDNKAHLNLITCTGVWNYTEKTYTERLVVFTDME